MEENREAMNKAIKLLAVRAHSTFELRHKLRQKGFSAAATNFAISECLRLKFLDDRQFAEMYLQELQSRGYGSRRCRLAMQRKGISGELLDELGDHLSPEAETERAQTLLERKLHTLDRETDPRKKKEKAVRFMLARGFSLSTIMTLYARLNS